MESIERKFRKTYEISGRTTAGKHVIIGFCNSMKNAITLFINKYPRFKGVAEIRTQFAEDMGNGMLCADHEKWETIDSFESTKELKEYIKKANSTVKTLTISI